MQGWFGYHHFLPSCNNLPIFVGTHFAQSSYKHIEYFIAYYPWYFANKEIGCRDLETLRFCQRLGIKAYLSRCLTLTLPKREENISIKANKVFLVGIPQNLLEYIPEDLCQNAVEINQQCVKVEESLNPRDYQEKTYNLLQTYKQEAKLVITCALHCAAPCIAMGIPVVLIAKNQENINRFSALNNIIKIWTIEDCKAGRVNFNPTSINNIESLKANMLENLHLSIKKEFQENIDEERLKAVRQAISDFKADNFNDGVNLKNTTLTSTSKDLNFNAGGGDLDSKNIKFLDKTSQNAINFTNTWKADFKYDLEFKQRAQILLDLLSSTAKNNLKSVLDLGCGMQYFREILNENNLKVAYCGVDLYAHKEDNILCDFNANEFPKFSNDFDCIVCAGLFEYIYDLPNFIAKICNLESKYILCSYNFDKVSPDNQIWVKNRLNQQKLLEIFFANGYSLNTYKTHRRKNPTGYFLFCKLELMSK